MSKQIKFTQELKDKWLEALRSGEYSQTTETLKDENGFCCLGVLCDVIDPDGWKNISSEDQEDHKFDDSWLHIHGPAVYGSAFHNMKVKTPEGFNDLLPIVYSEFTERNDGSMLGPFNPATGQYEHLKFNFNQMADWIEKEVPADG